MLKRFFERDLREAIAECERELDKRKSGIQGDCTVEQIDGFIIPELKKYLYLSVNNKLPRKKDRWLESAYFLNDGWGDHSAPSKMACMILKIDDKYF